MLKFQFDPRKPYRLAIYLRMSSDQQNERSPDQQLAEVERRLQALGYPWIVAKTYRDDAKSGRFLRKRPAYQLMLQDIKTSAVMVDLIVVDNIERFGRVEELPTIRKELFDHYGVLVVSADTGFCDPTTPQGKAIGTLEAWRASDANRIKALEVVRGKRDAAQRKFWPGGEAPFGYALHSITSEHCGKVQIMGSVLRPSPETAWIMTLLFQTAFETGYGETRLAQFLNAHPEIPDRHKPFYPATVGDRLQNQIYKGVLVWNENCTGIVDDVRILQPNPIEDVLVVPDFCPPLTTPETWDAVNALREARAEAIGAARGRKSHTGDKQITAAAPGLCLRYLLTGLVRCAECRRAMTPSSSPVYVTKAGVERRYVTYVCPGYLARICSNGRRVPEEWLRRVVVHTIRQRLFPPPSPQ
jgi:DNA invertase Pin-like site-specific DNA recombinase